MLRNLSAAGRLEKTEQMLNGDWSRDLRACAMALVLVRAGLGIDMATVRSYGLCIPAMALLPSLIESLTGAAVATAIIPGMPLLLGWTMSFIVSAVGPAIVSAGCGAVKDRGFNPRAPNFLMTTCCFDDAVCIIGFKRAQRGGRGGVGLPHTHALFLCYALLFPTPAPTPAACCTRGSSPTATWATSTPSVR